MELLAAADRALYQAKHHPQWGVVVSEEYDVRRRGGRRAGDRVGNAAS
jgi:hypothetical protein